MFQFPGFAFITLCIQVINTWFTALLANPEGSVITQYQVGCPIQKSMDIVPILGSPWLIAEYHVFHRLLLPRHSPNALFALDLIQKKKDLHLSRCWKLVRNRRHSSEPKAYFPDPSDVDWMDHIRAGQGTRVSVLDLDNSVRFSRDTKKNARKHA